MRVTKNLQLDVKACERLREFGNIETQSWRTGGGRRMGGWGDWNRGPVQAPGLAMFPVLSIRSKLGASIILKRKAAATAN